ncbi:MAG: tyrosine-type recombinase/integrase [Spirochaetaceae bacterium]|nr:tyrosine-type recombinase/integrase [Spirochaetaceae bacterium]MDT8296862.1 tyrosine-type recombinase/integrase [Spirochaetaceae bacterium]
MSTEAHDWLEHLRDVRRLSDATIRSYRRDLAAWGAFLSEHGLTENEAGQGEARSFMARMSSRHMAPATVNRRLSALKGYYEWRRRRIPGGQNPFSGSRTVKKGRKLPGYLTHDEIELFLEYTGEDFAGLRDRALFELLYSTGCRVGEICSLDVSDVMRRQVRVRGKGNKERLVFVGSKASEALDAYLPLRLEHVADDIDSRRALILDLRGNRLTTRGVYYLIRRYAALTGMAKNVTPHTFRHSFATHVLDEGADIRVVQEMLGHASISTTQIYTHTGIERIKQVYRLSHPHAKRTVNAGGQNG